jgi:hypothetical protein
MTVFKIGELHPNSPHLFADLVELLLLVGDGGRDTFGAGDIEGILRGGTLSTEELDEEEAALALARDSGESTAAGASRLERQIEDIMSQLSYRSAAFGNWYPFTLCNGKLALRSAFTAEQRVYRLVLACSRLRSFGAAGRPQRWASGFTRICKLALQGLAPTSATTHYGTDLKRALVTLGHDLGVASINVANCETSSSSGDAGFDLVATLDFADGATTAFAVLAQCGAQETGWPKKTLEAHSLRFRHFYQVQFDYPSVMMTPVCFRDASGAWVNGQAANGIFLTDRGRILHLLEIQGHAVPITGYDWFREFEEEFEKVVPERNF